MLVRVIGFGMGEGKMYGGESLGEVGAQGGVGVEEVEVVLEEGVDVGGELLGVEGGGESRHCGGASGGLELGLG